MDCVVQLVQMHLSCLVSTSLCSSCPPKKWGQLTNWIYRWPGNQVLLVLLFSPSKELFLLLWVYSMRKMVGFIRFNLWKSGLMNISHHDHTWQTDLNLKNPWNMLKTVAQQSESLKVRNSIWPESEYMNVFSTVKPSTKLSTYLDVLFYYDANMMLLDVSPPL